MSQNLEEIVAKVIAELKREGLEPSENAVERTESKISTSGGDLVIDLADPTLDGPRHAMLVDNPVDPDGLRNLMDTTAARLGVGRAGARPKTQTALLFQADHGVTQDAIYGEVSDEAKDQFNLFTVTSKASDRGEYLLRPDLGRQLSDEAVQQIEQKCVKNPDVQICVIDGLSAAAITNNLKDIYPVIEQGLSSAGLTLGTPFFVQNGRVGIMNSINSVIKAKVVLLLIGERPGLGIADAMSAYMGFDPQPGKSDADRDLICMITTHGGTNPLEAGAYIVEFIKKMIKYSASGIKLREVAED